MVGAHQLNAVLHTVEAAGKAADHLIRYKSIHGSDSGHIVIHIVHARQTDILCSHDLPLLSFVAADNGVAPQEYTVRRFVSAAEGAHTTHGTVSLLACNVVVLIENRNVTGRLEAENVFLCSHILLHPLMHIQVVGGQIRYNSNMGTLVHGHELEAGQL